MDRGGHGVVVATPVYHGERPDQVAGEQAFLYITAAFCLTFFLSAAIAFLLTASEYLLQWAVCKGHARPGSQNGSTPNE